jgi:hypothetical protein
MKHWKLILTILIVLVIIVVALFVVFSKPKQPQQNIPSTNPFADAQAPTETLSDFTANCFKNYIQTYVASHRSASTSTKLNQYAASCFTQDFINQWPSIISSTDGDPVLLAQDYDSSWATDVAVTIASQSSTDATTIVNLGTGTQTTQRITQLQMTPDGWRISAVSSPNQQ